VIKDVYFRFDSDEIVEGVKEIDKVVAILKTYNDVAVELTAYCDARGSVRYNERLAERRAQRVEDYIVAAGIERDRIYSIDIGENKLYNNCENCTEEDHQQNRRVEFTLKVE
jgi:outer membrane protein OmpA-like peptidoglycan-associated protein